MTYRSSSAMDEGLTKWLSPAAYVLLNFLVTTGEEVNLVKVYKMNLKSYRDRKSVV